MKKWSVEYSISQDCFHVDDLERILKSNTVDMFLKHENDYKIIAIFETQKEANEFADECRRKIEERNNERNLERY